MTNHNCTLCPRMCGADRAAGETGFCRCPAEAVVAKTMLHQWEEPALSPNGRSGAIFFGGCSLGCLYCQNHAISGSPVGTRTDGAGLRQMMEELIARGAENIDLVTPGQYLPTVLEALARPVGVPVVYNCGGYERVESIRDLTGKVDIYLPDFKYMDKTLAARLSGAPDYPETAANAIREMAAQVGPPQWEGEKLVKGVVIRHLILPGQVENSLRVLDWIGENFTPGQVLVSLMRQYTPMGQIEGMPEMSRRVTEEEYQAVLSWMYLNDLEGFVQEESAADAKFIPDF
ncbi:MAG: radical SAM protein [Faecousia sp.]